MIFVVQSPSTVVELPNAAGFSINPTRARAARTALAGNVIRQESALHASTAEAVYARDLPQTVTDALIAMHELSSSVYLWYMNAKYAATMSLRTFPKSLDMSAVEITFSIVRKIT